MNRVTKLASAALIALTLAGGVGDAPSQQLAGDPSQWGVGEVYKKGSFDITETEQTIAGSKGDMAGAGRDPSIAGSKGDMGKNGRDPSIIAGPAGERSKTVGRESS